MNIKKSILLRVRIAFLLVVLFAVAVVGKIIYIQRAQGEKWKKIAEQNTVKYMVIKAARGNILSDDGSLLATSLPYYKLIFDPTVAEEKLFNKSIDSLSMLLSDHFEDKSSTEYRQMLRKARSAGKKYLVVNRQAVSYQTKKLMTQWPIFREGRGKGGIIFERTEKRFLPFPELATRIVGFMNEQNEGVGLEYTYNKELSGKDGQALCRRIAGGSWAPLRDASDIKPENGYDIHTTIDVNIQDLAQTTLRHALVQHQANYGCLVLMETATGEMKAIVNLGRSATGEYYENYNYAIGNQGLTDPGSTFKLASLMALLEDSNIKPDDMVETGNGSYRFFNSTMTDAREGGYGSLSVQQIFEKSSNIGVSKLIFGHFGKIPEKYLAYLKKFGLTRPLGVRMKGEATPYVKNTSDRTWSKVSLPWMSVGYELKMSPIHMLAFYNAVANNGKMVRPMIVKEITSGGNPIQEYKTEVLNDKICSDKTLKVLKDMLEGVVEHGTAKGIKTPDYKIAGKTGTAQKIKGGAYTKSYYTSFVGYFPADKPLYTCIVVVDEPKGFKQYGGDVAAPVFREIADKLYARDPSMFKKPFRVPISDSANLYYAGKAYGSDVKTLLEFLKIPDRLKSEEEWLAIRVTKKQMTAKPLLMNRKIVPDVTGMVLRDALYMLENKGLKVFFKGRGKVMFQSVPPGTPVKKGDQITLELT